jgi:tetratricopeptide (TPR) repeat protein
MSEADYIVVLDTGSDDNTYELLKNDSRVYRVEQKEIIPWRFDVARNESLQLAPNDANILISTDLDELLEPGWAQVLRDKWVEGLHTRATYKYAWSHYEDGTPARIFQYNKIHSREWIWNFPVHECLVWENDPLNVDYSAERELYVFDEIYLHHYPDQSKSRSSYLPLLELRKKEYPTDYYGKIYLAHEYFYRGYYTEAIEELQEILNNYFDKYNSVECASCYLFMGDAYKALGDSNNAITAYQKALLTDKTYREPYINLATVLNEQQLYGQAIGVIQDCFRNTYRHYTWLERDTSWTYDPYDILSIAYYYTENYNESYINMCKVLNYCPDDERFLYNLEFIKEKIFD